MFKCKKYCIKILYKIKYYKINNSKKSPMLISIKFYITSNNTKLIISKNTYKDSKYNKLKLLKK